MSKTINPIIFEKIAFHMRHLYLAISTFFLFSCSNHEAQKTNNNNLPEQEQPLELTIAQAFKISELPIACITTEYPNKTSQSLTSEADLGTPSQLHPAFYGCFDWHSSVHAHWSIATVLNTFPSIKNKDELKSILTNSITKEKIDGEIAYFKRPNEYSYERTYGWAWLLKLSEVLYTSKDEELKKLHQILEPLTLIIIERFTNYLPKLQYPQRVGTHTNTAFGLSLAYDYAVTQDNKKLQEIITKTAKRFYATDTNCPLNWEPSGSDFLSPCLEEANLMRKILPLEDFKQWFTSFLPEASNPNFHLERGIVVDRTDGHLVHLDGLNYSRAWCLYGLAKTLGKPYAHFNTLADDHISRTINNLSGDAYEGSHWLGTFALKALLATKAH